LPVNAIYGEIKLENNFKYSFIFSFLKPSIKFFRSALLENSNKSSLIALIKSSQNSLFFQRALFLSFKFGFV